MKRILYLVMVLFALLLFTVCNSANDDKVQESSEPYIVANNNNAATTTKTPTLKVKVYQHAALQGAVIIYTNKDKVTYQQKCESCGYVSPGKTTFYAGTGTRNSSFNCPKCKYHQTIQIKSSSSYQ